MKMNYKPQILEMNPKSQSEPGNRRYLLNFWINCRPLIIGVPETVICTKENVVLITEDCWFQDNFAAYVCPRTVDFVGGRTAMDISKSSSLGSGTFNSSHLYKGEIQLG